MKKISLTTIITTVVIFCSSMFGFSQSDSNPLAYQPKATEDNIAEYISVNTSAEIALNEVSSKAIKSFTKQFANVSDAKWYKTSEAFVANFTSNGTDTKVIYDLKGNWHCMLRTYDENTLPFDVRDLVKSKYYDYTILVVYEITHTDKVAYILKIEDSKKIKTLRVTDGNMEVIGDYVRG
jgi:hypothetical protein